MGSWYCLPFLMVCKSVCGGCLCIPHEDIQSACVALKHARLLCSWLQLAISRSSVAIKAFLQQDKTRFVDHVCAFAAKAADESNARALYWAVKRLKKFKAAPLRGVLLRDGARALTLVMCVSVVVPRFAVLKKMREKCFCELLSKSIFGKNAFAKCFRKAFSGKCFCEMLSKSILGKNAFAKCLKIAFC